MTALAAPPYSDSNRSLICVFNAFKSSAPNLVASSSLIFAGTGSFTFLILQANSASFPARSFDPYSSGNVTLTFRSSPALHPTNFASNPGIKLLEPKTNG